MKKKVWPYHDILDFFVAAAQKRVSEIPILQHTCSQQVHEQIEEILLSAVNSIVISTLHIEFCAFRSVESTFNVFLNSVSGDNQESTLYERFISEFIRDQGANMRKQYPLILEKTEQTIGFLLNNIEGLFVQMQIEWPVLKKKFNLSGDECRIISLKGAVSDPHQGHQTVKCITFKDGAHLIYKPRSLKPEAALNSFLRWINQQSSSFSFKTAAILDRDSYGYMEYIDACPCRSEEEYESFFYHLGGLFGLSHICGSSDLHFENLIANGPNPIIIDAETILPVSNDIDCHLGIQTSSLISTPHTKLSSFDTDISVLGALLIPNQKLPKYEWTHINTDAMEREQIAIDLDYSQCNPFGDNEARDRFTFRSALLKGMFDLYQLLMDHKDELLCHNGPFRVFRDIPLRFLLRHTNSYALLLRELFRGEHLKSDSAFEQGLKKLEGCYKNIPPEKKAVYKKAVEAEKIAFRRGDIPYFTVNSSSAIVESEGISIPGLLECSPMEHLEKRIDQMGDEDLKALMDMVKDSLDQIESSTKMKNEVPGVIVG